MSETKGKEQRRICWPDFDATCLEGGCGYCNQSPFRNVVTIKNAVLAGKGRPSNRGNGTEVNLWQAFVYGSRHGRNNAESRIKS